VSKYIHLQQTKCHVTIIFKLGSMKIVSPVSHSKIGNNNYVESQMTFKRVIIWSRKLTCLWYLIVSGINAELSKCRYYVIEIVDVLNVPCYHRRCRLSRDCARFGIKVQRFYWTEKNLRSGRLAPFLQGH